MFVIVGLGNPGARFEGTLHNTGFGVIDALAKANGIFVDRKKCKALVGEGVIAGKRCVLCKPQTFMNLSGESVVQLLNWYKCAHEELILAYDDVDLPLGKLRFRMSGSAGTHNGMRNIVEKCGFTDFPRIRVGCDKAPEFMELADYVLSKPRGEAQITLNEAISKAAQAIELYLKDGAQAAQIFVGK